MINLTKHKQDIFAIGILSLTIYLYLMHFLGFDFSNIFGDLGDARLNNYFLEHGYQYLLEIILLFGVPPFYYPAENVMTYLSNYRGI